MATGIRCITYKNAYEIPHIIQGGFHPKRRRSDGGFLIAEAMRIPGRTQSATAAVTAFPMQSDTRACGAGHRERPEWKKKKMERPPAATLEVLPYLVHDWRSM